MENRVNYFERQFLRSQDFRDEQAYHIAMRRRHNVAHHSWGIVRGLELIANDEGLFIQPGLAIDGYGRELLLAERRRLVPTVFEDVGGDLVDVYLTYGRVESDPPPAGYVECDPDGGGANFYRSQERVNVRLLRADPEADPRCPREVAPGDRAFNPARRPPDSPLVGWPVFLGQLARDAERRVGALAANRPYAGLVGEVIHTPARRARLVVGQALADVAPEDGRRFAVHLRAQDDDPCGVVAPDEAQLEIVTSRPRDAQNKPLDWETKVDVRGATTVHGSVAIAGGSLAINAETPPPNYARPWQIYRVTRPEGEGAESKGTIHEMRVELPVKQAGQIAQLVIGAWSAEEKRFMPCLTVTNACTVIVHGKLIAADFLKRVEGKRGGETTTAYLHSAGLTPAAQSQLMGMLGSGIFAAKMRDIVPSRDTMSVVSDAQSGRIAGRLIAPDAIGATAVDLVSSSIETLVNVLQQTDADEMKRLLKDSFAGNPELAEQVRAVSKLITNTLPRARRAGGNN